MDQGLGNLVDWINSSNCSTTNKEGKRVNLKSDSSNAVFKTENARFLGSQTDRANSNHQITMKAVYDKGIRQTNMKNL